MFFGNVSNTLESKSLPLFWREFGKNASLKRVMRLNLDKYVFLKNKICTLEPDVYRRGDMNK
jgi:hypothetical protein